MRVPVVRRVSVDGSVRSWQLWSPTGAEKGRLMPGTHLAAVGQVLVMLCPGADLELLLHAAIDFQGVKLLCLVNGQQGQS